MLGLEQAADPGSLHDWAYLVAACLATLPVLVGVVFQARKTRNKGTEEHQMARELLESHSTKLDRIDGKVDRLDIKVDRIDGRVDVLEAARPLEEPDA